MARKPKALPRLTSLTFKDHGRDEVFTFNGRQYSAAIIPDDNDNTPPWKREDGHGPVLTLRGHLSETPDQRVLDHSAGCTIIYDYDAAIVTALRDWVKPGRNARARAVKAVDADLASLKAWYNDEWRYVGVVVIPTCDHCEQPVKGGTASVWGIEDTSDAAYLDETIRDLVAEIEARTA